MSGWGSWGGALSRASSTPPLFHWSPVQRRAGILRAGLRVGQRPVEYSHLAKIQDPTEFQRALKQWRAPYVCFGEDPLWAWHLSGQLQPSVPAWDLWWVWLGDGFKVRRLRHEGGNTAPARWAEWRVFEDLPKSMVRWVGSRPGGLRVRNNPPECFPAALTADVERTT